jgi:hypothetical protein
MKNRKENYTGNILVERFLWKNIWRDEERMNYNVVQSHEQNKELCNKIDKLVKNNKK